jgi:phosphate uptake regulator
MNFQDLFKTWRGQGLLSNTLDEFVKMLDNAHWMYTRAATALWEESDVEGYKKAIRDRDILVNKAERRIRKKVIRHLAINPGKDVNQSLVLMSVVKDAERLGDYAKNMIEVSEYRKTYRDQNELVPRFKAIQTEIEWMFEHVGQAFRDGDEKEGRSIVTKMNKVTEECDHLIEEILNTDGLTVRQGASYALLARYYKRFAAHLGNIATSIIMPTHKLDYYDEDL